MEIVGLLVGILGLVFAFEEPRRRISRIFQRDSSFTSGITEAKEDKPTVQATAQSEAPKVEAESPAKTTGHKANPFPGYGALGFYEMYVLSFSTYPSGITMTETRKKFAASQANIEEAVAKLEIKQLIVVSRRDGELHWKVSEAGKQFLKDNPYALYLN